MTVTSVTPLAGLTNQIVTDSTPVTVIPANAAGGFITNPASNTDQGIGTAEILYVNPVGPAGVEAYDTTFALLPGQTWEIIPGQSTATSVNALTGGHRFSVVYWL